MSAKLNPIKRVWKPKVPAVEPTRVTFDIYGRDLPHQDALEKNTDSIWDTYEALQGAEAQRLAKVTRDPL